MNNGKLKYILIVFILIIYIFFNMNKLDVKKFIDELLFFKVFNSSDEKKQIQDNSKDAKAKEIKKVYFNVSCRNLDFKNINLNETIKKDTLINEKIAPGTKGEFEIILNTNEDLEYEIKFESNNKKPVNLVFYINGNKNEYNSLDELEKKLKGRIKKSKTKNIHINWEWIYEVNKEKDIQDTKDGITIEKYIFKICIKAKQYK